MANETFDLVVIGAGPGGYVAAIRAAQLGMKVAVIEKRATLGGTCLNVGCIPSKALLQSSHLFEQAGHDLAVHGIQLAPPKLDFAQLMKRKADVVEATTKGVAFLFKKNKIAWFTGTGRIEKAGSVAVLGADGAVTETLSTRNVLIASGSEVMPLPGVTVDEKKIVSSTGALELGEVPKRLVVVGGGIIGLELGSVWRRLGADVTVVEFLDRIVPGVDDEVTKHFQRALAKQGLKFKLGSKVTKAETTASGVTLTIEPAKGGAAETLEADVVLVSIGRRPCVEGLGLDKAGVKLTARGRIEVDAHFQTSVPGIYAIGDVIDGPMLAHKASEDGVACVETLAGQKGHVNWDLVPSIIYTQPEVAWVGKTEEQLKAAGIAYKIGKYPFTADPRSRANGATEGFVKVLADKATDQVLGVHIIGAEAGTMIAEAALAMEFSASAEDIGRVCHAHPTVNEAMKEAALAAWDKPIHL
ncbi:dihydrolipoamide dehydrogenase [Enhydrobacter aerosaccus]|uniref:Dihydrolipoyl dehydrogenase n=1 Tax=Enhydrobacter aerosaccus TaxID=225324 RepID=A0A1T4NM27_9HYPH|nr:dihydrolipoyl dehydrogenase [Enhydrobacter aerosaccus]SJZ80155.1 dihydrolipoamide dehydrogenase [Enhydrobacter aerosaccus]